MQVALPPEELDLEVLSKKVDGGLVDQVAQKLCEEGLVPGQKLMYLWEKQVGLYIVLMFPNFLIFQHAFCFQIVGLPILVWSSNLYLKHPLFKATGVQGRPLGSTRWESLPLHSEGHREEQPGPAEPAG